MKGGSPGKVLKVGLIVLVVGFVLFTVYDGLLKGQDQYSLALGAGHRYFEDGAYARALDEFASALAMRPGDAPALYGLAISRMQLGQNDAALEDFSSAIAADDNRTNQAYYLANRGILYDRMGAYQLALADYEAALDMSPETAQGPGVISRVLRNQADPPPTIADRARYLRAELAKPEGERLLSVPISDRKQRVETVR